MIGLKFLAKDLFSLYYYFRKDFSPCYGGLIGCVRKFVSRCSNLGIDSYIINSDKEVASTQRKKEIASTRRKKEITSTK
jgi:hypothetical protein